MEVTFLGTWLLVTPLALVSAGVLFWRGGFGGWTASIGLCTAAAVPGWLLLLEVLCRTGAYFLLGALPCPAYDYPTTLIGMLWILLGPALLGASWFVRPRERMPRHVLLLEAACCATWAASSAASLIFAASI